MKIDPTTGRPYGDHGTADDAVAFILNYRGGDIEAESFLRYWDVGDLRAWPEYYSWLAARELARPTMTPDDRRRRRLRYATVGVLAVAPLAGWALFPLGGPTWAMLTALFTWLVIGLWLIADGVSQKTP